MRNPSRPATPHVLTRRYAYYDPIDTLPASGRRWWAQQQVAAESPGG